MKMDRRVQTTLDVEGAKCIKSKSEVSLTASAGTERLRASSSCNKDVGMRCLSDVSLEHKNIPLPIESRMLLQKRQLKRRRCWSDDTTISLEPSGLPNILQIQLLPYLMNFDTHATTIEGQDIEHSCRYPRNVSSLNPILPGKSLEPKIPLHGIDENIKRTVSEYECVDSIPAVCQSILTSKRTIRRRTHLHTSCYTRNDTSCATARIIILCLLSFTSTVEPTWRLHSIKRSRETSDVRYRQRYNDSSYKIWDNFESRLRLADIDSTSTIRGLASSSGGSTNSSESINSTTSSTTNSTNVTTTSNITTTGNITVAAPSGVMNANKGKLHIQPFCKHNYIQITSLRLLCDTPGAYYYGSNAYRKSDVCQSGDKANIEMDFIVPNRMRDRILYMKVEFGLYDRFKPVNTTSLCALPVELLKAFPHVPSKTVTETSSPSAAPTTLYDDDEYTNDDIPVWGNCINASGRYHVNVSYTVPKIRDNNFHYTPDVRLTFTDIQARTVGCTVSGPYSLKVESDIRSEHGWIALGISCAILAAVFTTLLYMSYKRNEERMKNVDTNDQRRKTLLAQRRLNNLNHYQYFRTLPNGQVVPLPGLQQVGYPAQPHPYYKSPRPVLTVARRHTKPTTVPQQQALQESNLAPHPPSIPDYLQRIPNDSTDDDDDDSDDDSNPIGSGEVACNPQYNETQLPTRPVI